MKRALIIIPISCLLLLTASMCKKEEVPNNPPYKNIFDPGFVPLEPIWKRRLDTNTVDAGSINPMLNSNGDIVVSSFTTISNREPIMLFSGKTGEHKWKWDDYLRDELGFWDRRHVVDNDILVLCAHNATYALNIVTGQTVWRHFRPTEWGSSSIFKDDKGYVYHIFSGENSDYANYVYRTKIDQLNWELVCTLRDSSDRLFTRRLPENITFTTNQKGDQLMLFSLTLFNTAIDGNTFLACYNINEKKYEWVRNYYQDYNEWGHTNMHVCNNMIVAYAYLGSNRYLIGVNLENGNIEWEQPVADHGVDLFKFNNTIISTVNGRHSVIAYNPATGQIIWEQKFNAEVLSQMNFLFGHGKTFKHFLFSTHCERLVVLNLIDGNVVYNERISTGCLEYGAVVDEHNKTFFVVDGTYINCYKLPKEIQF